jgi:hypothetical protein
MTTTSPAVGAMIQYELLFIVVIEQEAAHRWRAGASVSWFGTGFAVVFATVTLLKLSDGKLVTATEGVPLRVTAGKLLTATVPVTGTEVLVIFADTAGVPVIPTFQAPDCVAATVPVTGIEVLVTCAFTFGVFTTSTLIAGVAGAAAAGWLGRDDTTTAKNPKPKVTSMSLVMCLT